MVNSFSSPDSIVKAYSRCVSNVADNAVSALRVTNNMIFSNLDSWKSVLEQAKDNSKHISNLSVNTAKTFEQNSREIHAAIEDSNTINNRNNNTNETTVSNTTTTTTTTTKQQKNLINLFFHYIMENTIESLFLYYLLFHFYSYLINKIIKYIKNFYIK